MKKKHKQDKFLKQEILATLSLSYIFYVGSHFTYIKNLFWWEKEGKVWKYGFIAIVIQFAWCAFI